MPPKAEIDLWRRFRPTGSQRRFLTSTAFGRLFSSGAGSGKTATGCRESIRFAIQYAGSRNLIARLTATDLRDTTMVTFWKEMETIGFKRGTHYNYNRSDRLLSWWNGSVTIFRHLDDEEGLGSLELSSAFVDEGSEVPDSIYKFLVGSRFRWHLPGCQQQPEIERLIEQDAPDEEIAKVPCYCKRGIWVCTNPGDSGYLREVTRGNVPGWEWIPAKPGDNPYNGPEYYERMEENRRINGEVWMKRYYEGDWDAFEGQRFPMFDREKHVLDFEFKPDPDKHVIVEGWDFGHVETFVVWLAFAPDGSEPVVVFDELQAQEVNEPSDVADAVKAKRTAHGMGEPIAMGDPRSDAAGQFSSVTPYGAYAALGVHISPAKHARNPTDRADLIAEFLTGSHKMYDGKEWPGIVFNPSCPAIVSSLVGLRWKPQTSKVNEDPREVFLERNKHGFDALGYAMAVVPMPREKERREHPGVRGAAKGAREAFAEAMG